jgi:hypothetical protein
MNKRDTQIWRRVVGSVKGGMGETDFNKKIIKIDKAKHKKKVQYVDIPKQDNTLINTITHEELHVLHPKKTEKQIRKLARLKVKKASRKLKAKLYNRYK